MNEEIKPLKNNNKTMYIIIAVVVFCFLISGIISSIYMLGGENKQEQDKNVQVKKPELINNRIHWQGNCTDCGGLVWVGGGGSQPWNKYYKMSCVDESGNESESTQVFGPVNHFNWQKPKIRMQADGVNPCGNNTVRIYRGNDNKNFNIVTNIKSFSTTQDYNGKDAIFTDMT
jgi:hypothetical protein